MTGRAALQIRILITVRHFDHGRLLRAYEAGVRRSGWRARLSPFAVQELAGGLAFRDEQ